MTNELLEGMPKELWDIIAENRRKNNERLSPYATKDNDAIYEYVRQRQDYRSNFGRDIDTILNNVFYSRFGDKTQVHSFYKNDDLTRRSLHVQLVSRIAKTIGEILNLNLELIEAIALGHDIGHTPFGHRGEDFLSDLYYDACGKYFNHNVHSVRAIKVISKQSVSLQTLDGVLSHNGEFLESHLTPTPLTNMDDFNRKFENSYTDKASIKCHKANSLEGCLVRICDIIAYIGKDRQDLHKINQRNKLSLFTDYGIGVENRDIITNVSKSLIRHSYDKGYIMLGEDVASSLSKMKADNYSVIYKSPEVVKQYAIIQTKFKQIFDLAYKDLTTDSDITFVKKHFLSTELFKKGYALDYAEGKHSNYDVIVDYIASMTDDYFIDLAKYIGLSGEVIYTGYFD